MTWLAQTPIPVVHACLEMLPRLQAEESILATRRIGVGAGAMEKHAAMGIRREWGRQARGRIREGGKPSPAEMIEAAKANRAEERAERERRKKAARDHRKAARRAAEAGTTVEVSL